MLRSDYVGRVSHTEHLDLLALLEEPSGVEWQLMRVAQRVQQVLREKPEQIKLKHQEVHPTEKEEFLKPPGKKPAYDPVAATKRAEAIWEARLKHGK